MEFLTELWGVYDDIPPLDLAARALVMFVIALAMLRLSGMRPFGKGNAFDNVIIILLGGILSRGVVGATPFVSAVAGGIAIMLAHRLFAWAAFRSHAFGKIAKGHETLLYRDGVFQDDNMRRKCITRADILEELRIQTQRQSLDGISEVYFERNGVVSFVKKQS